MSLEAMEPDAFALRTARYDMFKRCAHCAGKAGPVLDYVNKEPWGDRPIYQSIIECMSLDCGASVRVNTYSRKESQRLAIARWQRRAP